MIQPMAFAVGRHIPRQPGFRSFVSSPNTYADVKRADDIRRLEPIRRYAVSTLISTLDPARITAADYLDLSRRARFTIRFPESRAATGGTFHYRYGSKGGKVPFPPQSTGFLYFNRAPDAAPLEGSIRLRVTPDNLPSSFPLGHDLALPSGLPWQLLILQLATPNKLHYRFCDQLVHDKLVTPDQLAKCRAVLRTRLSSPTTLFRLGQPFPVNFDSYISLVVVGEKLNVHTLVFRSIFYGLKNGVQCYPWAGSALARFEHSTRPEHVGRRVVHLRILEITKQVSRQFPEIRLVKPEAGRLLAVHRPESRDSETPWAYDIDTRNNGASLALRVLWDVSAAAGYFDRLQS
ncbi:hypothetical protein C8R47DRAFT_1159234 [Mycena vitilis]|nr:hypothetical protein C8R47DRAFT_1168718 [Mycena vitilis]KAJ6461882.1 hypothetical protein C8R47DRAFT_1159234 [Mycena vitilis]